MPPRVVLICEGCNQKNKNPHDSVERLAPTPDCKDTCSRRVAPLNTKETQMTPKRCVIYARYSSDRQQPASIEDQVRKCRQVADQRGWKVERIYADKAVSATNVAKRHELQALMKAVASRQISFEYILVEDTSRIARTIGDAIAFFDHLKFYGVFAFYVNQNIDTASSNALLMLSVHGIVDSVSNEQKASDTFRGIEGRVIAGFSGGGRRFGYCTTPYFGVSSAHRARPEGYKLIPVPEEVETIRRVFDLFCSKRKGLKAIAKILNSELVTIGKPIAPGGGYWSASTIKYILQNELYIGRYIWRKTRRVRDPKTRQKKAVRNDPAEWKIIEMPELRLISDELWDTARQRFEKIQLSANDAKNLKALASENLLTGILKCKICGSNFVITSGGRDGKYGCSAHWRNGGQVCANTLLIRRSLLEELIVQFLCRELLTSSAHTFIFEECALNLSQYFAKLAEKFQQSDLEEELCNVRAQHSNIINALLGGYRDPSFKNLLADLRVREADIINLIHSSQASPPKINDIIAPSSIRDYFRDLANRLINPDTTRIVLAQIVESIVISPTQFGMAEIHLVENNDHFKQFLFDSIEKSDSRIRYEMGTRFIPYTRIAAC